MFNRDESIYREDTIIAATAADADLLYNKNILDYLLHSQSRENIGGQDIAKRISIECLGEFNHEIPHQNRVAVLFKYVNITDTYTYSFNEPLTVNAELIQWGFGVNNRSIAIVKILEDVINPELESKPIIFFKGQIVEAMPHQIRFI